jgi:hypothetical protein
MTSFDSPSNGLMVEGAAMNMNLGMYKWVMALWNAKATNVSDSYHDLLDQQVFFVPPPFCHCMCDIIRPASWVLSVFRVPTRTYLL